MRLLSAGLIYVAVSTVAALLLGENAGGLNLSVSFVSLIIGATGAIATFFLMPPSSEGSRVAAEDDDPLAKYRSVWLCLVGFVLRAQLAAAGLLAALASFYALYRWGGTFTVAGFLFNGGIAGYAFLQTHQFLDYQGTPHVSWKSIPLTMFVTQRGLLYAIPAGLLLLWQWRARYGSDSEQEKQLLPVWAEYILYATMPLFHVHTFIALSIVLLVLFLTRPSARSSLLKLVAAAVLPAVIFIWLTTDKMRAGSILQWHFGWTQNVGELKMPFFWFWFFNFGVFLPLAIALIWIVARQESNDLFGRQSSAPELKQPGLGLLDSMMGRARNFELSTDAAYLAAAVLIFLLTISVKTAPWEWDNIKLLIWAYLITLPILWNRMLARWPLPARAGVCLLLFFSGFVSLIGA